MHIKKKILLLHINFSKLKEVFMKRILFLICCLTISTMMFAQSEISKLFPTLTGLQRTTFFDWLDDCHDSYSTLTMPTETAELNGKQYLVFETSHPKNAVLLREEDNKVLIYSSAYEKDLVLYDWTLKEGDYLSYLAMDPYIPFITIGEYEIPAIVDWHYVKVEENGELTTKKEPLGKKKVTKVSTITLLDGNEYKMWEFDSFDFYIETLGWISSKDYRSGDYFRLIEEPEDYLIPTCYLGEFLVCVSRNGQMLYSIDQEEKQRYGAACKCLSAGAEDPETNIETITTPTPTTQKIIHNGQLYIIRDGKTYNVMGVEIENMNF